MAVSLVADITLGQADAYLIGPDISIEAWGNVPFEQSCGKLGVRCNRSPAPRYPCTIY